MRIIRIELAPPSEANAALIDSYAQADFQFDIPERVSARPFVTLRLPFRTNPRADIYVDADGSYWRYLNHFPPNGGDADSLRKSFQACLEASHQSRTKERFDQPQNLFSIIDGRPYRRALEPMLGISITHHADGRPPQIEASIVTGIQPPKILAGSDSARTFFRLDRRVEMDAAVEAFRSRWPRTSPPPRRRDYEMHENVTPRADDLGISLATALPAVLSSGHALLELLPRGALDAWLSLRLAAAEDAPSREHMACIAGELARFSAALTRLEVTGEEDAKWIRRARIHTQLLSLRLAAEPDLIPPDPFAGLQI